MPTYRTKGIIIKYTDLREADRIITIFTSTLGKVRAVAKGVRKTTSKLGGHLEIFNMVELELAEGRNLETITAAQVSTSFSKVRSDLNKTSLACYLIELIDKLTPDEHCDTRIFNLVISTLEHLDKQKENANLESDLIVQTFKIKLLKLLGFDPQLQKCVQCEADLKTSEAYYFSNLLGGVLCSQCRKYDRASPILPADVLKLLRVLDKHELSFVTNVDVPEPTVKVVSDILNSYLRFIMEEDIKSLDFIRKINRL